jgi:hypothetical protein
VIGALKWIVIAVALLILPAAMCNPEPVVPTPSAGGSVATGGAPAVGGVSYGGTSPSVGGASSEGGSVAAGGVMPSTVAEAITWPECSKGVRKLAPSEVERYRRTLGPKRTAIKARPRASYVVLDLPSVLWAPLAPTLDQGNLGSCTGNAAVQVRVSKPWTWSSTLDPFELEAMAIDVYSAATRIDPFAGRYPPDDTGSNGEAVMSVMRSRGLISGWVEVYTFEGLQRQIQKGPCIVGTNWYSSMYSPNSCGQLEVSGTIDGGHEWTIKGLDYATKRILGLNSWGDGFGARRLGQGGYFWITFGNFSKLLETGDIHCPIVD